MEHMDKKTGTGKVVSSLLYKFFERSGVQGIGFVISIIVARLVAPSDYGVLAIMNVFIALSAVFVQSGFNTSLVQNADVTEEDYSSVFYASMAVAVALYACLYFIAPVIARYYDADSFTAPFRVVTLMLIPGAINSIQVAKITRELQFKKLLISSLGGTLLSGVGGIYMAYRGYGIWALVVQQLTNITGTCIIMLFTVDWRPKAIFSLGRVKVLFAYGWKLLMAGLLDTLYQNLQNFIIGKKYSTGMLGYYNRGQQFPQTIISNINTTIQSVMLPVMSAEQKNEESLKAITRKSMIMGAFLVFPMMAGLAAVAKPLVILLLTEKWLPCVPFLQVMCITYAFWPIYGANLSAINAKGRSDIYLKLEIIKKVYGVAVLAFTVLYYDNALAIAIGTAAIAPIGVIVNALPGKKIIGYSLMEQLKDISPALLLSLLMFGAVQALGMLPLGVLPMLCMQVAAGIALYAGGAWIFRMEGLRGLCAIMKNLRKARAERRR